MYLIYVTALILLNLISCGESRTKSSSESFESKIPDDNIRLITDVNEVEVSKKRVIVIAGQSNAIGWASRKELRPEVQDYDFQRTKVWNGVSWGQYSLDNRVGIEPQLAYTYEKENPNDMLYIVKYAVDATSLERGKKHWHPEDKAHYKHLVESLYRPALSSLGDDAEVMAMLWFQGESDSLVEKKAVRYAKNLDELYKSVKRDMPEIKNFVIGGIPNKAIWKFQQNVRAGQENLAAKHRSVKLIDTDKASYGDTTHYDVKGYEQIADRFWTQIKSENIIR